MIQTDQMPYYFIILIDSASWCLHISSLVEYAIPVNYKVSVIRNKTGRSMDVTFGNIF